MLRPFIFFFALTMLSACNAFPFLLLQAPLHPSWFSSKRILRGTDFLFWTCFLLEPKYNFFWLLGCGKCSPFFPNPSLTYVHGKHSDKFCGKRKSTLAHSFSSLKLSLKLAPWRTIPIYLLHTVRYWRSSTLAKGAGSGLAPLPKTKGVISSLWLARRVQGMRWTHTGP